MIKTDLILAEKYGTNTVDHFGINTSPVIIQLNKLSDKKIDEMAKSINITRKELDDLRGKGKWHKIGTTMFTPDHDFVHVNIAYFNGNKPTLSSPEYYRKKWENQKERICLKCKKSNVKNGIYCKTCTHQDLDRRNFENGQQKKFRGNK